MGVIRAILKSSGKVTQKSYVSGDKLLIARSIYQNLGSLIGARKLVEDYASGSLPKEYIEFLDEMEQLKIDKEAGTADEESTIYKIDTYLSELGISTEWKYSGDIRAIPMWLDYQAKVKIRNVAVIENFISIDNVVYEDSNVVFEAGD